MMGRMKLPLFVRLWSSVVCLSLFAMVAAGQSPETMVFRSPLTTAGPTFVVARSFMVTGRPSSVAAGDLNGDGKPDLVITRSGSSDVTVMLGNGNGGFASSLNFLAGTAPEHVLLADLN